ncbi:MAG: TetR/AcrR family transcriptional regulator [Rhodococcus sp. (in: high G+C Gram-positive bacteria)]
MNDSRARLTAAGLGLLEREGLAALTVRKLASEVGTSTMAVYTHFGGMPGVVDSIVVEAFARFARALTSNPRTDDAVADFFLLGIEYRRFALEYPQRYKVMFGIASPGSTAEFRTDITATGSATNRPEFEPAFGALRDGVRRMITARRIRDDDELAVAGRLWTLSHGSVLLEMAGFFGHDGRGLTEILGPVTVDVLVGMGDDRAHTERSLAAALAATGLTVVSANTTQRQ